MPRYMVVKLTALSPTEKAHARISPEQYVICSVVAGQTVGQEHQLVDWAQGGRGLPVLGQEFGQGIGGPGGPEVHWFHAKQKTYLYFRFPIFTGDV